VAKIASLRVWVAFGIVLVGFATISSAAADDSAVCGLGGGSITASYNAQTGKVDVVQSLLGQTTPPQAGVSYHLYNRAEFLNDASLVGYAQQLHLNDDSVQAVADFLMLQDSGGNLAMLKFEGAGGATLKIALAGTDAQGPKVSPCN